MEDRRNDGQRPPATLASIAARVGVSANTVSRALRAPDTVRPELRRKIATAMEDLNYVPNRLAGGLAGTRSDLVGVVVTSLYYSEFATIVDRLQSTLLASNLHVMLANTRYDADEELKLVRSMLSWRPAAIAIIGVDHHPKVNDLLRHSGVPIVEMWDLDGDVIDSAAGLDHGEIGAAQARHLIERGYRNLAFLGSMREIDARAAKRAAGMRRLAERQGLPPVVMKTRAEPGHPDLGEALCLELLADNPAIDGIVCNSDTVAYGVLRGLRKLAKNVPEDVGVIGFGDAEASACLTPTLSSVRPDRDNIGRLSAEIILERLRDKPSRIAPIDWDIVARDSSRRGMPTIGNDM
ncbi:LacI family DNA-binding transcriptional regulator [Rhizobium halophytocola]|uniref:LacI family gluconate utilization system Gnt-I transcriptional repressor n=1 Tax=Rhizobium halophytocola TaxID=735519 RepID=A0ABS4E4V4_9HYPH|nr:LacI family DNA-binding transcriptional regulator [Rhizobium halophytocola]MBP1852980.1 LacI family gluconate utilization system Gnt-I transcriptional repressor [Rhizobium halophytocola]